MLIITLTIVIDIARSHYASVPMSYLKQGKKFINRPIVYESIDYRNWVDFRMSGFAELSQLESV